MFENNLLIAFHRAELNTHGTASVEISSPRSSHAVNRAIVVPEILPDFDIPSPSNSQDAIGDNAVQKEISFDDFHDTDCSFSCSTQREAYLARADQEFKKRFLDNEFGHACDVCARIWFKNDLKPITSADIVLLLATNYFESVDGFTACLTCRSSLKRGLIPTLSQTNGFTYPDYPSNLPPLDPLTTRLVSPRINFMQLRRLRHAAG